MRELDELRKTFPSPGSMVAPFTFTKTEWRRKRRKFVLGVDVGWVTGSILDVMNSCACEKFRR